MEEHTSPILLLEWLMCFSLQFRHFRLLVLDSLDARTVLYPISNVVAASCSFVEIDEAIYLASTIIRLILQSLACGHTYYFCQDLDRLYVGDIDPKILHLLVVELAEQLLSFFTSFVCGILCFASLVV